MGFKIIGVYVIGLRVFLLGICLIGLKMYLGCFNLVYFVFIVFFIFWYKPGQKLGFTAAPLCSLSCNENRAKTSTRANFARFC
ncbi:hypothetical protein F383_18269 [Gossypium arboreum]|uniref:Uncharacterized protein n=1 Tax=Gossypium arboreum TaxID=29729 RepID=A0A0B0M9T9_GOSAR|nr:hypothetical protein F383_36678 [Gossypium arboreum]KHG12919.1 hypothetical protein F383_18269 [Gossypium arboreum]